MKTISALLLLALTSALLFGAPKLPATVTMKSGAVLRNISVVRWQNANTVVLKHLGGTDPVRLDYLTPESKSALEAYRDAVADSPVVSPKDSQGMSGEVFIVTKGRQNIRIGSARVAIYGSFDSNLPATYATRMIEAGRDRSQAMTPDRKEARSARVANEWRAFQEALPAADSSAFTNSDGKFTIGTANVLEPFFLVVTADRLVGDSTEHYLWVLSSSDIKDRKNVVLGSHNLIDLP